MKIKDPLLLFASVVFLIACNEPTDDGCPEAIPSSYGTVVEDSLCFGHWEWVFSEKLMNSNGNWVVVDTVMPGTPLSGFETVHQCSYTIDRSTFTIKMNDTVKFCPCIEEWESFVLSSGIYVISIYYLNPPVPYYYKNWAVQLTGERAFEYHTEYMLPYHTTDASMPQYEGITGIRYQNIFKKVE